MKPTEDRQGICFHFKVRFRALIRRTNNLGTHTQRKKESQTTPKIDLYVEEGGVVRSLAQYTDFFFQPCCDEAELALQREKATSGAAYLTTRLIRVNITSAAENMMMTNNNMSSKQ